MQMIIIPMHALPSAGLHVHSASLSLCPNFPFDVIKQSLSLMIPICMDLMRRRARQNYEGPGDIRKTEEKLSSLLFGR